MKRIGNGRVKYKTNNGKVYTGAEHGTEDWEKIANMVARVYSPEIIPCKHCDQPVAEGYCCSFCGSDSPR